MAVFLRKKKKKIKKLLLFYDTLELHQLTQHAA